MTFSKDFKTAFPLLLASKVVIIAVFSIFWIGEWFYGDACWYSLLALIVAVVAFISESSVLRRLYKARNIDRLERLVILFTTIPVIFLAFAAITGYASIAALILFAGYYVGIFSSEILFFKGKGGLRSR
jgi:cytochrome c oxidase assembly factor CtaG